MAGRKRESEARGAKAVEGRDKVSYPVACIFSAQHTFTDREVRRAPGGGGGTVVPRKGALAELEREYQGYLADKYDVDRLQADASTIVLLGVVNEGSDTEVIDRDSGHPATLTPRADCDYTYSICFDALIDFDFPVKAFWRKDRIEPSRRALKGAAKELEAHLGQNVFVDRLEVLPNGVMYFMMLDAGAI